MLDLGPLQVVEQLAPLTDHAQQTAARMVILGMCLEVFGQVRDTRSQQRHLDFGRTRVALGALEILQHLCLLDSGYSHVQSPPKNRSILTRNCRIAQAIWTTRHRGLPDQALNL